MEHWLAVVQNIASVVSFLATGKSTTVLAKEIAFMIAGQFTWPKSPSFMTLLTKNLHPLTKKFFSSAD